MSEKDEAKLKRNLILEAIENLSDEDILENENFTFWGKPGVVTQSHNGGSHPPTPPPPPPPPGE